jgi:hypothetical protein
MVLGWDEVGEVVGVAMSMNLPIGEIGCVTGLRRSYLLIVVRVAPSSATKIAKKLAGSILLAFSLIR